jgi:hypothetical protein
VILETLDVERVLACQRPDRGAMLGCNAWGDAHDEVRLTIDRG